MNVLRRFTEWKPRGSPHEFRPLPLLSNPHLQTLLSAFLPVGDGKMPSASRRLPLEDGDQLVVHHTVPDGWTPGGRIVLIVHGLGGCHRSTHVRRLAVKLWQQGFHVVRVDLRGCGDGIPLARRGYHGGCSDDLRHVVDGLACENPSSPITLVGFSLGGNIVLKLAAELSGSNKIEGVAAAAPPIDLGRCVDMVAQPRNRLYELNFLRELIDLVRQRERCFPDMERTEFPRRLTLRLFDELYTAPKAGFRNADHYYECGSSRPILDRIDVPSLILTARDDPFIDVELFHDLQLPCHVQVRVMNQGGHLGFLGWDGDGGICWAEKRLLEWIGTTDRAHAHRSAK